MNVRLFFLSRICVQNVICVQKIPKGLIENEPDSKGITKELKLLEQASFNVRAKRAHRMTKTAPQAKYEAVNILMIA